MSEPLSARTSTSIPIILFKYPQEFTTNYDQKDVKNSVTDPSSYVYPFSWSTI